MSLSWSFPTNFCLKRSHNCFFIIFWIFLLFFWNFLLRVGSDIIFVFRLSRPFSTYFGFKWSKKKWYFLKFFPISLEFSITRRVGTKRNENFCFLSFSAFFNLFSLYMKQKRYFLRFFPIFLEFSITRRVGTKRNDNFCFPSFSAFLNLFWL